MHIYDKTYSVIVYTGIRLGIMNNVYFLKYMLQKNNTISHLLECTQHRAIFQEKNGLI